MRSLTLATLLFLVLVRQHVDFAKAADPYDQSPLICRPKPEAETLEERSICPFKVREDIDVRRMPYKILHFDCNCPGVRCSDLGDYRCVQATEWRQVSYWDARQNKGVVTSLQVNAFCVCAASASGVALQGDRTRNITIG
ncbi:hypothetical protein MTO96_012234 [Rhipicephalus appendiculatus]